MPLHIQVKLLRVLQERQVRPLGASQSYTTDTRFLAASNRNLKEAAENGSFRADLYYRLNVITILVPPLRERGADIERLARHFMAQSSRKFGGRVTGMSRGLRRGAAPPCLAGQRARTAGTRSSAPSSSPTPTC